MTPDNFKTLNAILGLRDWAIDAECDDRELSEIALQISAATGLQLDLTIGFVAAIHATARALQAIPTLPLAEGRA